MTKIKTSIPAKNLLSYPFKLFKKKGLSVYQFSLILIVSSSILSILIISTAWTISENNEVQKKISVLKENAIEKQKEKLKEEVIRLIDYLKFIKQDTISYTQEQLKDKALRYFESIRFGKDGYVFVNTYSGNALLFNGKKLEEPKRMSHLKLPSGINLFKTEMNLAKLSGGGSFQYEFMKMDDPKPYPKMSYIMGFDQWEWILGAGDYLDNLDNEIVLMEKELKSNLYRGLLIGIGIFIPLLILLLLFSTYVAKLIQNQFDKLVTIIKNPIPENNNQPPFDQIYIRELKAIGTDIIQAEEIVKQFGNIIDQSNNEIYVFLKDSLQFVHANNGAIQNCGYSISELQNMTFLNILANINNDQFLNLVAPLNNKLSEKIQFESIYQRKNRTTYPIDVQLTLSNFNKEEVYVAFIYDITDRKKTEEELINSKNYVQTIFNSSTDAIFIHDAETGKILDVNKQMCLMFGYEKSDVIGKTIQLFSANTEPYTEKEAIQWLLKSKTEGKQTFEWHCKHKNGHLFWGEVSIAYIKIDDEYRFLATTRDIDDRKKAEQELKESENHFRQLFEANPQPMWIYDLENLQFKDVNNSALKKYGYSKEAFFSMTIKDIRPSEDVSLLLKNVAENTDESQDSGIWRHQIKNGDIIFVEIFSHNLMFQNKPARLVLINDITDRKKAEQELAKYREHLEEIIEERTKALSKSQDALLNLVDDLNIQSKKLETSNKQLAEINEELETFTYSVSHDLKAPLRGIDGYSQLLLENYKQNLNSEAQEFLMNIRNSTEQMNVLIEDLLAYSRMERRDFEMVNLYLNPIVENCIRQFSKVITENKIQIDVTFPEGFKLIADKEGLQLSLRNLIDNAIKFSKTNKISKIEIGGDENEIFWHIFVKDNGIGFDMKYHDRIFKIFQRLHLAEEYEGTGIGLAMVYKAMHRMNGRVWAESKLNEGTCFHLEINKTK